MEKNSENKEIDSIIRGYYIKASILSVIFIALIVFLGVFLKPFLAFLVGFALYCIFVILVRILAGRDFNFVLFCELDSEKFKKLINDRRIHFSVLHKAISAMYSGDYQTIVNITSNKMREKGSIKAKLAYAICLARAYFEIGDLDKLKAVCDKMDEYIQNSKYREKYQKQCYIIRYYRSFINGDFDSCVAICEESQTQRDPKKPEYKIASIYNKFNSATAYYRSGDTEKAKIFFEEVVADAPKLNLSRLAEKYLTVISTGDVSVLEKNEILPQENYVLPGRPKFLNICRRIIYIICAVVIVVCAFSSIMDYIDEKLSEHEYNEKINEYNKKLNKALLREYESYKIIDYFNVEAYGENIDVFCIVQTADENIDLLSVVSYDNGETFSVIKYKGNVATGKEYNVYNEISEYYISFQIYSDSETVPENVNSKHEISINNTKMYFCITKVYR